MKISHWPIMAALIPVSLRRYIVVDLASVMVAVCRRLLVYIITYRLAMIYLPRGKRKRQPHKTWPWQNLETISIWDWFVTLNVWPVWCCIYWAPVPVFALALCQGLSMTLSCSMIRPIISRLRPACAWASLVIPTACKNISISAITIYPSISRGYAARFKPRMQALRNWV